MKSTLLLAIALVLGTVVGCANYNGIAINKDKMYMSYNKFPSMKGVTVCTIGSDGMISDCKEAK